MSTYTFEFSTTLEVEANSYDEAIQKAWDEFSDDIDNYGTRFFVMYDPETGKEI